MEALIAHCSAAFSQSGGLLAVFFLGGLMGSLTHCVVMCGPVVACQSACSGSCGKRLSAASQWQYHLGRFVTYGALGFCAALLSRQFAASPYWPSVSAAMMALAGAMFLLDSSPFRGEGRWGAGLHRLSSYAPTPALPLMGREFLRGVLMSFMPCGLMYAALMMAATFANPITGMVAMWLFVLDTLPALLVVSGSAAALAAKWQKTMHAIGRYGMAFNGLSLVVMAAKTMR